MILVCSGYSSPTFTICSSLASSGPQWGSPFTSMTLNLMAVLLAAGAVVGWLAAGGWGASCPDAIRDPRTKKAEASVAAVRMARVRIMRFSTVSQQTARDYRHEGRVGST